MWLAMVVCALAGCHGSGQTAAKSADAQTDSGSACAAQQTRPRGGCCAPGSFFDAATGQCVAAGLPECAATGANLAACHPRWCRDTADWDAAQCPFGGEDCPKLGHACAGEAAVVATMGCPAGSVPDETGSGCRMAGAGLPAAVTPAALPAATTPVNCFVADGSSRDCAPGEQGCPAGQAPDKAGKCVALVGPIWTCPPGFVVAGASTSPDTLPPCAPDSALCGDDAFGGAVDGPKLRFVSATATDAQNGTRAAPFATIAAAVADVPADGTVVVGQGSYVEVVAIGKAVTVRGRCAALVKVVGGFAISGQAGAANLADLAVGGAGVGLSVALTASAVAERMWITGATVAGVSAASGSKLVLSNSVVAGTAVNSTGQFGYGLLAATGATVTANGVRLTANRDRGIYASGAGVSIALHGVVVDGTLPNSVDLAHGRGLDVQLGAAAVATDARFFGNREHGVYSWGKGSTVTLRNARVDGTRPRSSDGELGVGVVAADGGWVQIDGAVLQDNSRMGCNVIGAGAKILARNTLVTGTGRLLDSKNPALGVRAGNQGVLVLTGSRVTGTLGAGVAVQTTGQCLLTNVLVDGTVKSPTAQPIAGGVLVQTAGQAVLQSVRVSGNQGSGIDVRDAASNVTGTDVTVDTTTESSPKDTGVGIAVGAASTLALGQSRVTGNTALGILAAGSGATVALTHVVVDHTQGNAATGAPGMGISIIGGARLTATDCHISHNRYRGIFVYGAGSSADLKNVAIDATEPSLKDKNHGIGLVVRGSQARWTGGRSAGNCYLGILVTDAGAALQMQDVAVVRTRPNQMDQALSGAVSVIFGASLQAFGCRVADSFDTGMTIGDNSRASFAGCLIADTKPNVVFGTATAGIIAVGTSQLRMTASELHNNHLAAVIAQDSLAVVKRSLLGPTLPGTANSNFGPIVFADGLIAMRATLTMTDTLVWGNPRAGVLVQDAGTQAELSAVAVTQCGYGVVTQGGATVSHGSSVFFGNTIQNLAGDAGLQVPVAPALASIDGDPNP